MKRVKKSFVLATTDVPDDDFLEGRLEYELEQLQEDYDDPSLYIEDVFLNSYYDRDVFYTVIIKSKLTKKEYKYELGVRQDEYDEDLWDVERFMDMNDTPYINK